MYNTLQLNSNFLMFPFYRQRQNLPVTPFFVPATTITHSHYHAYIPIMLGCHASPLVTCMGCLSGHARVYASSPFRASAERGSGSALSINLPHNVDSFPQPLQLLQVVPEKLTFNKVLHTINLKPFAIK